MECSKKVTKLHCILPGYSIWGNIVSLDPNRDYVERDFSKGEVWVPFFRDKICPLTVHEQKVKIWSLSNSFIKWQATRFCSTWVICRFDPRFYALSRTYLIDLNEMSLSAIIFPNRVRVLNFGGPSSSISRSRNSKSIVGLGGRGGVSQSAFVVWSRLGTLKSKIRKDK